MTEEIFVDLDFIKEVVTAEMSGDSDFYYYSLDIGDITIMSNSDDQAKENGWEAFIFDSMTLKIRGEGDLKDLVRIVRNNTNV
jgi:hypothetical protein